MIGFVIEIEQIINITEDFQLRIWDVQTKHGARTFETKLDAWPHKNPDETLLIEDVSGDLFVIKSVEDMGKQSKKLLSPYID